MGVRAVPLSETFRNSDHFGRPVRARSARSDLYKLGAFFVCAAVALDLHVPGSRINLGNVLLIAVAFVLVVYSSRTPSDAGRRVKLLSHDWAYLLSAGVMLASMAWSISAIASLVAVVPLIVLWIATLFLGRLPYDEAVQLVIIVAVVAGILSLIIIPFSGDFAYQPNTSTGAPELRGIFRHQLRLGSFMALAIGLVVIAGMNGEISRVLSRSRVLTVSWVVLLVVLLLMSRTRLYVAAAAIALLLTLLLSRRGSRKWIVLCVAFISAVPIIGGFGAIVTRLEGSGFDTSLTGRTLIWRRTLRAVTEDIQLLGHGFGTFELPKFDYLFPGEYRPVHAHSSFVQAYFETGQVGVAVLILLILIQALVAWRYSVKSNRYSYGLFLVLYNAIGSVTGLNYAGSLTAMFCIMMLFLAIESRALPSAAHGVGNASMARSRRYGGAPLTSSRTPRTRIPSNRVSSVQQPGPATSKPRTETAPNPIQVK